MRKKLQPCGFQSSKTNHCQIRESTAEKDQRGTDFRSESCSDGAESFQKTERNQTNLTTKLKNFLQLAFLQKL